MILKKLIVQGFKSFPDKTEFDFHEGITCIVGPNGCGKSNVVDAIKWVLGEQSARSLRGHQMADMIFNGSSTRRSSGLAQVDLVFDNQQRKLGLDQPEVTVSRRLYRSGESEYLINNNSARLKDVRELFLDTGVGVDAYSIIEQGKVDVLLQSNPQDRRVIFEEAAGISKYKVRRKEAQRKLERTQQNLLRAQDIIDELEKRLRSVKIQATKARRYQEYDQRLRELRSSHALFEYDRLTGQLKQQQSRIETLIDEDVQVHTELSRFETQISELSAQSIGLDQDIESSTQATSELQSRCSELKERIHACVDRVAELQEQYKVDQERLRDEAERGDELEARISRQQAEMPALQAQYDSQRMLAESLSNQEMEMTRELSELQAWLEDEKSGVIDLLRQSSDLHNEITNLNRHRDSLDQQRDRLKSRDSEINQRLETVLSHKAVIQNRLTDLESLLRQEERLLQEKRREEMEGKQRRDDISDELARLRADRKGLASEQELLRDLENKMEGVDQAVRDLLHRKASMPENPRLASIHGIVADVLTTDMQHAEVIESALEPYAQHLVVQDSEAFLAINGELGELKGRLHVLCVDRLPPYLPGRSFEHEEGYVARALDWVRYPEACEYLARNLLGRTIVVTSLQDGLRLAHQDAQDHVFVTLKGEVIDSSGRLTIGPKSKRTGLISRKSRLQEIAHLVEEIDLGIEKSSQDLVHQDMDIQHTASVLEKLSQSLTKNHADRAESQSELQHMIDELDRLTREQPLIAGEVEMLEQQMTEAMTRAAQSQESLAHIEEQNRRRENDIKSRQEKVAQLVEQKVHIAAHCTEAKVAAGQLAEKKTACKNAIDSLQSALEAAHRSRQELVQQAEQTQRRIEETQRAMQSAKFEQEQSELELSKQQEQTLQLRRHRESLRVQKEQLDEQTKSLRQQAESIAQNKHELEMEHREISVRRDELCTRIREELNIDLHQAHQSYDSSPQDQAAIEQEITDLRQKISNLGNINLDAIAEQEELQQRLEFLLHQRKDLEDSQAQLEQLIERLNQESRERFTETFEQIRVHFQELFRRLFGGGKADLILDPTCEDILEAGIEILVRPPGKELQSISLLSGGEKTLTAIALLLGIFKTKPSPFTLLDEVDAALDESNNERFNAIVQEFLSMSQFIVITHSKRTMHIADTLIGVTMQEAGVSRRIGVHFDDHAKATSAVA